MKARVLKDITDILELIEDKQFPAKRCLFDYVVSLIKDFDIITGEEADKIGKEYFKKKDDEISGNFKYVRTY